MRHLALAVLLAPAAIALACGNVLGNADDERPTPSVPAVDAAVDAPIPIDATAPPPSDAAADGVCDPSKPFAAPVSAVELNSDDSHTSARFTADELVAWGKEQMAGHKYPRIVEFVDALPMTATGKILKRELS